MKVEKLLRLISDMEQFAPRGDQISELISSREQELDENELELISAAGAKPSFSDLIKSKGK